MSDEESKPSRMRPLFLIKPKTMTPRDIRRAEKLCGIVIVECIEPDYARFLEPPLDADISLQARAALSLFRHAVNYQGQSTTFSKAYLMEWFLQQLLREPIPPVPPVKRK